jgi:hypothetical protein
MSLISIALFIGVFIDLRTLLEMDPSGKLTDDFERFLGPIRLSGASSKNCFQQSSTISRSCEPTQQEH